ncbi:uncharacterized protein TrAtP1_004581 [Trichoderma atroviride]|uniref:Uncharacterized protein n=1 Tax=Hypocrea atroviridis (strain ATCC 20476 / IMI 206040) TaxID=452589 RepID=G9P4F8_HYPAI|nr:uncharacterized protein TRIATDRAFT_277533 [Trichoderma atroviride IMI 206040]EHK41159.1 hypothetical protein TRIATDRAFT_277533 [Trichoderma atroviride IMI 206040]UKZ63351.1 hypothetical protein TrAtP1_004581 [Trichoderma atroviride]
MFSGIGRLKRIEAEASRINGPSFEAEGELDRPSLIALSIMKRLADAPPMVCEHWKKMSMVLSNTPSDFHTISTLAKWLEYCLRQEEMHWSNVDSFGNGLTLEKLSAMDFNEILDSICILSGIDAGDKHPIEAMQESFMEFAIDCMALQSMQERLKDSFLGRPIQRGGPTTLEKFGQRWQSVIEELGLGKMGAPMRVYLGMLGECLDPMTEDSCLHIEASTSEGAGSNDAGSKDADSENDESVNDDCENYGSRDDNFENAGSDDYNSRASDTNAQESLSSLSSLSSLDF